MVWTVSYVAERPDVSLHIREPSYLPYIFDLILKIRE